MRLHNQEFALQSGVCFVWRPGDAPFATHDVAHPLEVFACHFDWIGQSRESPRHQTIYDLRFFESSAHRAIGLWARGDESGREESRRLIESLLWQLHDESTQPRARADAQIEALANRVLSELSRSWNLDEMAKLTHLSRAVGAALSRALWRRADSMAEPTTHRSRAPLIARNRLDFASDFASSGFGRCRIFLAPVQSPLRRFTGQFAALN